MITIEIKCPLISPIKNDIKRFVSKLFNINNCYNCDRLGKSDITCIYCRDYHHFIPINKHSIAGEKKMKPSQYDELEYTKKLDETACFIPIWIREKSQIKYLSKIKLNPEHVKTIVGNRDKSSCVKKFMSKIFETFDRDGYFEVLTYNIDTDSIFVAHVKKRDGKMFAKAIDKLQHFWCD